MTYWILCPVPGCGQLYQDWTAESTEQSRKRTERSFKAHLTGKHCFKGEQFKTNYREAQRHET